MPSFCTNCAAAVEADAKFCGSCGASRDASVAAAPAVAASARPAGVGAFSGARGTRYPALRAVAAILKVSAVLALIGGVAWGVLLASLSSGLGNLGAAATVGGLGGFVIAVLTGLYAALMFWGSAELIYLVIDIEGNTRRGAAGKS